MMHGNSDIKFRVLIYISVHKMRGHEKAEDVLRYTNDMKK